MTDNKSPRADWFLYYLSLALVYAALGFWCARYLFDHAISHWPWLLLHEKMAFVIYGLLQFPVGDLYFLLTHRDPNVFFIVTLNPMIVTGLLYLLFKNKSRKWIVRTVMLNVVLAVALITALVVSTNS